jgi:hypothetical protein
MRIGVMPRYGNGADIKWVDTVGLCRLNQVDP